MGIGIINWISKTIFEFSLNYKLAYIITLLIFTSGLTLFLWNLKPFKRIGIYYGYYFITPLLALFFWLFGGIFLALISAVILYPIYPNQIVTISKNFTVYQKFQGFMGPCCPYEITEKHLWLIEEKLSDIDFHDDIHIHSISYPKNNDDELIIVYDKYDFQVDKTITIDTIITRKRK
ncbi:hypothetical protein [Mangrovimonas sp. ST2L15]|uniref:hypothetical protein n=1 Tax=Mangrovimonas sp. ST2L15 TaxID=1645916 RepID=UPI0012F88BC3|nr:hypothetical protein [Mangrovimonas sp. ST2L15]